MPSITVKTLSFIAVLGLAGPVLAQSSGSGGNTSDAGGASSSAQGSGEQASAQSSGAQQSEENGNLLTARALEGAQIVTLESSYDQNIWDGQEPFDALITELSEIGTVEDVVLNVQGQIVGLTTDVGGFIGIGEKTVLLPLEDIRLARTGEEGEDVTIVTRLSSQQLEDAPEFETPGED